MPINNPADAAHSDADRAASAWKLHRIAGVVIVFLAASFFLIQYDRNRLLETGLQAWYHSKVAGVLNEGDQYRIALPYTAHFLEVHTPLEMRQSVPLIESLCFGLGLTGLYALLVRSSSFRASSRLQRLGLAGLLFTAAQLPILWIFPWARPETLPTFCYLALCALVILEPAIPLVLACVLCVLFSVVQGFNRTDAPIVAGFATLLASGIGGLYRSRKATAALGALCLAAGIATQLYLRHLFPSILPAQRATTFQLFHNFSPRYGLVRDRLPAFLVALVPLLFSLAVMRRRQLDASDRLTLLISLVYLPMYMAFGIISEVRIYVPYLLLMAPAMAKIWMRYASEGVSADPSAGS